MWRTSLSSDSDLPGDPDLPGDSDGQFDWGSYLARFHSHRAGASEDVLARCWAGELTPYSWLLRAVAVHPGRVLDLACGSAATGAQLTVEPSATFVVGVDRSVAELRLAAGHGLAVAGADAGQLPFADGCFDAVVCSMGLMVVQPLASVLAECARVLRPGGLLAATVASPRPLRAGDLPLLSALTARLRSPPRFPAGAGVSGLDDALEAAGFGLLEDARERFGFRVRTTADARLLLASLYLPSTDEDRLAAAVRWLGARGARSADGVDVAVPVRRLVALRHG